MQPGTTLAKLDRETRTHHEDADVVWQRLRDDTSVTRDDYLRELVTTYGFEAPYEAACAYTPGLGQVIDLRGRWRSGLIAQDLLALGWVPDEITKIRCAPLATFQDVAEALGWMYVVERSTLVHDAVRASLVSSGFASDEHGALRPSDAFVGRSNAWRMVLRRESDDFSACGATTLDGWAGDLLKAFDVGRDGKTDVRRELRKRGVAAFGMILAA